MELSDYDNQVLPPGTNDSWRTWLMTGIRRPPVDRRRVRGAHKGLKRMLVEGMAVSNEKPYSWKEFSDAMVRQAVGDAVRSLPLTDSHVVKLAYFGAMSNGQIADRLGISVASVERRLRDAVRFISRQVEHGRSAGRRALGAVAVWLSGRWLGDATHHLVQATAMATVAVVIATHPAVGPVPVMPEPAHVSLAPAHLHTAAPPDAAAPPAADITRAATSVAPATSVTPANPLRTVPLTLPALPRLALPVKVRVHLPLRA